MLYDYDKKYFYEEFMSDNKREIGYVYILTNPSMPGLVKIGRTNRDPEIRLKELNKPTSVATPFVIEFTIKTQNAKITEKLIHDKLIKYRVNKKREFFKISLAQAHKISLNAAKRTDGIIYKNNKKTNHIFDQILFCLTTIIWSSTYNPIIASITLVTMPTLFLSKKDGLIKEIMQTPAILGNISRIAFMIALLTPFIISKDVLKFATIDQIIHHINNVEKNTQNW